MPALDPTPPVPQFHRREPGEPRLLAREPILIEWLCAPPRPGEGVDRRPPPEGTALPEHARRRRDPGEDGPAFDDDEAADDDEAVG
jgi:hypothetical protein